MRIWVLSLYFVCVIYTNMLLQTNLLLGLCKYLFRCRVMLLLLDIDLIDNHHWVLGTDIKCRWTGIISHTVENCLLSLVLKNSYRDRRGSRGIHVHSFNIFVKHSPWKNYIPSKKKNNLAKSILTYSRMSNTITVVRVKCSGAEWEEMKSDGIDISNHIGHWVLL